MLSKIISDPDTILSIDEICKTLNLSERKVKEMLKDSDFMDQNLKLFDDYSKFNTIDILKILNNMAKQGDIKAIKLLFEVKDKIKVQSDNVMVNIIDDIPK